ncbi:MAG TPA: ABC transporter permease [Roseiflexaceae bacterium]|nr:ABC transporter permease [Roseiflexaceae bacterium]
MTTTTPAITAEQIPAQRSEGQWAVVIRRFTHHRMAMVSLVALIMFLVASLLAPYITPFPRDQIGLDRAFLAPMERNNEGGLHILGTDHIGRDLFTRVIYAARISIILAVAVSTLSSLIGMLLGLLAGYFLGWVDIAITRTLEFISTFPLLPVLLVLNSILLQQPELLPIPGWFIAILKWLTGVPSSEAIKLALLVLSLALLLWTGTARLMRGMVLSVRELAYIESSRALGASHARIILRHVLPNSLPPLIVDYTLAINGILVLESVLSFLGYGVQDPTPTWGNILQIAESNMFNYPWMPLVPGIPLVICALAVNFIGDGLRDALDPRTVIGGAGAKKNEREERRAKKQPAEARA